MRNFRAFRHFSWVTLGFLFLVIAWGAFVRATGSGAGCGDHWPTCNGEIVPRDPSVQTIIEFTHRLTSGLSGILVLIQVLWGFWLFPKKHVVRKALLGALFFLVLEAAIGAGIVLFEWVAHNVSVARALSMSVHLTNTFLLLSFSTAVVFFAKEQPPAAKVPWKKVSWVVFALLGVMLAGLTGTIAALGDTLLLVSVPLGKVNENNGLLQFLLQLRISHPLVALGASGVGFYAASVAYREPRLRRAAATMAGMLVLQLVLGLLNVAWKAPVAMQLIHLLVADAIWVGWVWVGLSQWTLIPSLSAVSSAAPSEAHVSVG